MNHLELVAAMVDELGLVECIDPMMPQDINQRSVSIGLAECRLTAPPRQASPATPPKEGNFGRGIPLLWRGARRAGWSLEYSDYFYYANSGGGERNGRLRP
jgi:hypothetical protein